MVVLCLVLGSTYQKKKKMFGFGFQCNVELRSWV